MPAAAAQIKRSFTVIKLRPKRTVRFDERDLAILHWLTEGKTGPEIAQLLNITRRNVKFRMTNMLARTDTVRAPQLIAWAFRNGVLK